MDAQRPPPSSGEVSASSADEGGHASSAPRMTSSVMAMELATSARMVRRATSFEDRGGRIFAALERITVPTLALLSSAVLFGLLLAIYAQVNPLEAFALMYQGAFGSWFSWQNTLLRAAPLILTALCTALPARMGLIVIGNEGALVVGGVAAAAAGIAVSNAPSLVVQLKIGRASCR